LQKDVQIHQADNERIKKAKRQQEDFNMKLMRSLKRSWIKKVDPANQGATGPLMRKEEKEVVTDITNTPKGIPKGRPHNSSSPSPTRKHRRSEVDELKGTRKMESTRKMKRLRHGYLA